MGRVQHHLFERFLTKTAHHQISGRNHIIGGPFAPRAPDKITGQQQTNHLGTPIFHGLCQRRDTRYDRPDKIHFIAGPDNSLACLKAAIILDLVKLLQLVGLATGTDRPMSNRTITTAVGKRNRLFIQHSCHFARLIWVKVHPACFH